MISRKVLIPVLAIAAVAVTSVASAFLLGMLPPKAPGIYVTITPVRSGGGVPRNAYVVVQVSMVTPDGPMKVVYRGRLRRITLFIPYDKVAGIASEWIKEGHVMPGVIIDYWIVSEDGKLIASGATMANYDPAKLLKLGTLGMRVTVTVTEEPSPPEQGGRTPITVKASPITERAKLIQLRSQRTFTWYEWRRVLYIAPENCTGRRYVRLPILTLYNSIYSSTTVRAELDLAMSTKIRFGTSIVTGFNMENKARTHGASYVIPELTYKIIGSSAVIFNIFGGEDMNVPPGRMGYVWIMARPVAEYQKEWECTADAMGYTTCQLTGRERVIEYVDDVKAYASGRLDTGYVVDYPYQLTWPVHGFSKELKEFLSHVDIKKIKVAGDPELSDGELDPNENLPLGLLFPVAQYTASDEEFVIPAGAVMAAMLVEVSGRGFAWLAPILATFSATATYQASGFFFYTGKITDVGTHSVAVYAGVTELKCRAGSRSTHMPVLYMETAPP